MYGAPKSTLDLFNKVQRRAGRLINKSLIIDELDSFAHQRDVTVLTIFYNFYHKPFIQEIFKVMPPHEKRIRVTRARNIAYSQVITLAPNSKMNPLFVLQRNETSYRQAYS